MTAETLAGLYRRAPTMVFPSIYEGFGAPPLEAMACGCPVACSDATSLPEVCGDAALPFDPHSVESIAGALARVSGDAGLREQLRKRASNVHNPSHGAPRPSGTGQYMPA